jgi:hypothetical protein
MPGAIPCGQQDESLLLCPNAWPAQAAVIVVALATPA